MNGTRLSNLAGGSGTVEVTILQLVTLALTRCTAMLNVSATVIDLVRIKIQKQSASVIGILTEFATNELEDMEGVGVRYRWRTERPPSRSCSPIVERLTNPLHNHSAEAFRKIDDFMENDTGGKTFYLVVDFLSARQTCLKSPPAPPI